MADAPDRHDRYKLLLDNVAAGVFVSTLDGRMMEASARVAEMAGYASVDEVLALHASELYADPEERRRMVAALREHGVVRHAEMRSRRKDGSIYWISLSAFLQRDEQGAPRSIFGIVEDISARKAVEEALAASEARLREAQRVARVGHFVFNLAKGVAETSEIVDEIVGFGPDHPRTIAGWLELVHPLDREELRRHMFEDILGRGQPSDREYRILHGRDGKERWIRGRAEVELDAGGKPVRLVGAVQDVTEHRRLEEQLRHSSKMEALGLLAGGIAHDLNNLLTPILLYGSILGRDGGFPAARREAAEQIVAAAERAQALLKQLMAFGRKQTLAVRPVDLNEVVTDCVRLLRRALHDDIRVHLELGRLSHGVEADRGQLEQALMNLAMNAQDAMPDGGRLTITTDEVVSDDDLQVRLTVGDTGQGMDPETMARIFEPFFTTKEQGKGTGLGLATVYGIVKQHGGDVRVRSAPESGSTFEVLLPARALPATAAAAPAPHASPRGSETILLAEDNPAVRRATTSVLEQLGYRVLAGDDVGAVLRLADAERHRIGLLLTDVVMPELSGKDLYEQLRPKVPGLKVLFMSGYTANVSIARGKLAEGVAFLQKPFSLDDLARTVREVLDGQGGGAEP